MKTRHRVERFLGTLRNRPKGGTQGGFGQGVVPGLALRNGHQVKTAHDGPTGLQEFQAFQPDIVLLDRGLTGLDGYETARQIRAGAQGHGVLLIAVTGWGQEEARRRTQESGFDDHLVKPLNFSELQMLLQFQVPGAHPDKPSYSNEGLPGLDYPQH